MTINDLELQEHHRLIKALNQKLDRLMSDGQYGSLADAYWSISQHALMARRKLRRMAHER